MVSIQSIDTKDPFYPLEQELRNKILLRPIGIPDHAWEMHDEKSWHFVAVKNDNVLGCVVLVPLNPEQTKTQLMQMAVETEQQGKGIGKLLVKELLAFSKSKRNNLGVSLQIASSFLLATLGQAVRSRFYCFTLWDKTIKSSTAILHATKSLKVNPKFQIKTIRKKTITIHK